MAYTNGIFFLDHVLGSDTARTALTSCTASNPSGSITRINKTAHGLVTGAIVDLTSFSSWLNAAFKITKVDNDNFDLDDTVWQATADASGTVTPRGGSSLADAWKTWTSGATAVRIQPGDAIRNKASPDPTLVGTSDWTQYSKIITLPGAVTTNITDCETAWTASANVTATADTVQFKEGTKSAKLVIAAGFTTGLVAYFATGTLDLSTKKQVSFWIFNTAAVAASTLSLRLCSDAAGVTTVDTITIPALPGVSVWTAITVDKAVALGSAIQSIALYADLDPGTVTIQLDNIIACKDSTSDDSLSLTSLIGKVHNLSWVASTTYAANTIRRPTQPNRNGLCYKVTAGGGGSSAASEPIWPLEIGSTVTDGALTWTCLELEDTWYPIQSINGTTVKIDNGVQTLGSAGRGYDGTTESVATYKREVIPLTMISGFNSAHQTTTDSGTAASNIVFSGGWNRTDMTTQTGETWLSAQNGLGEGINVDDSYVTVININLVKFTYGMNLPGGTLNTFKNVHIVGSSTYGIYFSSAGKLWALDGVIISNTNGTGIYRLGSGVSGTKINRSSVSNNVNTGLEISSSASFPDADWNYLRLRNNGAQGFLNSATFPQTIKNLITANNTTAAISSSSAPLFLFNASIAEATEFAVINSFIDVYIYSIKHDQTVDNHLFTTDGGTIISATDRRDVASGISWKFRPTSTNRSIAYPMKMKVANVAVGANTQVTMTIKASIDHANIKGKLVVPGGQIAGVPEDVSVPLTTTVDSNFHITSDLTFTPIEKGEVEVWVHVWDGTTTDKNLWIDKFAVSQA